MIFRGERGGMVYWELSWVLVSVGGSKEGGPRSSVQATCKEGCQLSYGERCGCQPPCRQVSGCGSPPMGGADFVRRTFACAPLPQRTLHRLSWGSVGLPCCAVHLDIRILVIVI